MKHKMGLYLEKVLTDFQKHPMKNLDGNKTNSDRKGKVKATTIDQASSVTRPLKVPIDIAEVPKLTAEGKQLGNGGVAANYSWTQTLEDISVGRFITCELFVDFCSKSYNVLHFSLYIQMVLKNHTQAKDLKCRIESTRLSVTLKSGQTKLLLAGEFPGKIHADESIWSLESNYVLHNSLEKTKHILVGIPLKGDPKIDTCQVDSRSDIHKYNEGT
ncbi:hypothetical protein PsorP6_008871 [Peronosclerospora sorghi]|uniref:Uncharacterized protein n=1 Tax=Peronosclerospora sorghi TaxID=230839 RepID=A0ACC0W2J3_9STRA|nr:hypothetical protein PsorP6_008871 [Peronosclerospora sorghi]